ncbi:MAG: phenylalanine--tRNA ligase subunit alpha [Nanoarchaeota archaeon]|nr:phenylalanine--tRNA ligase subunit alpha [Nanoarchaeota archaeon]
MAEIQKIIESLSPLERKIIPHLNLSLKEIKQQTNLDSTSLLRALRFLENKNLIKIKLTKKKIIELGTNGIYYKKNHLPERQLLILLESRKVTPLEEAKKLSKLSDNEFKVSLGVLKSKALIELKNGKIFLAASKAELSKKTFEELLLEVLPIEEFKLQPEQQFALENLKKRKNTIEIQERSTVSFTVTELGKQVSGEKIDQELIEEVTPILIKNWKKNKKFRSYDIKSEVPKIYGGKKHFVNQAIEKGKRIWLDLGFKEMTSTITQTSFWNFDALFTAQDHPVRDMHDTFFIKNIEGALPEKKLVKAVKQAHEQGISGSRGWQYPWSEEETEKPVLRTHTTCLSAQTLASLDIKKDLPAKFFAIGKCFRNETVDWSHGFEFNQSEGIVVSREVNFRHLLGYLKEFYKKMGFEQIIFTPAYFPYTEPSVEINAFHQEKQQWLELGGAGIFRPEVTSPLLGEPIPVLAWGPGFDRLMMMTYKIKDLRQVYENDLKDLRGKEVMVG